MNYFGHSVNSNLEVFNFKSELPKQIRKIRNEFVEMQELITRSLMVLDNPSIYSFDVINEQAVKIQYIGRNVTNDSYKVQTKLESLSPLELLAITRAISNRIVRFCDIHSQAHKELFPSEWMCEACVEESGHFCSVCHKPNLSESTGYCDNCIEAYKEQEGL